MGGSVRNTIGIDHNPERPRIKKLLTLGLSAPVLTEIGVFLPGCADSTAGTGIAASVMAGEKGFQDWQMIAGGLLAAMPARESFEKYEKRHRA